MTEKESQNNLKTKKKASKIKFNVCVNHDTKRAMRYCEECDRAFCNKCLTKYWSHNFISYAYLGEKKDFTKEFLCHDCAKRKRRKGVLMASSLLILLLIFIAFSIYNA